MSQYILDENGIPKQVGMHEWSENFRIEDRRVAETTIGNVYVSTVFLGIDHAWGGGPPVLWETMIFGGEHDEYQERYTSREDAIAGHARAVELVSTGCKQQN